METSHNSGVAFVDTETLGLHPDNHAIWEVGLILPDGTEHTWQIDLTREQIFNGDPAGMKISRFHERYNEDLTSSPAWFCEEFVELTTDLHLAGAVISFDEERLRRLCWTNHVHPKWHYHLIDVEAMAVGYLAGNRFDTPLPWNSDELTAMIGVPPVADEDRHTALGDARWAKAMYEAMQR